MGKQDIFQVLTPDHSIEATFLDEDATIGDLLAALAEDNPIYGNGFWAIVEVAMPRTSALTAETRIKEVQERYQEHLRNPDATIFKLINLQYTLPVVFRHVPTVPESHYRQLHVTPIMTVRQVLDIVIREMGLKALENPVTNGSAIRAPAVSEYIFSQLKVNGEGIEEMRQLTDDESPLDLLLENRELLMNQQIKDYHFVFTVPDSWISKVESVTSRITKGWTATRPLSMAVYGLFGGATSPQQTTAPREISAPIPIAPTSIHHPSYGELDHSADSSVKSAQKRRQSMIVGSRLSSFFDPAALGGWLQPEAKKRHSVVIGQSVPNLISKPFGMDAGTGGLDVNDMSDEELTDAFNALLNDLNIKDTLRESMMNFTREKKAALVMQNQQVQQQKERVTSPDPYAIQTGGLPVAGTNPRMNNKNRFIGSISSRVSFIEPDSASISNSGNNKLHSRHSSWSSLAGSYYGAATEEVRPTSPKLTGSDRPMSPTMAAAGSLWSSWFGATPLPDPDAMDEPADDSPQFYIDQLLSKTTTQKTLTKHLLGLRVALATAKLSWIRQFLDGRGFRALENVLEKTAIKKRGGKANDLDETMQSECVQCLRVLMNTEPGFTQVLRSPSLVAHISYCLYTTNSKLRTKVAEVLAALCVMSPESHRLVLMALSDFRVAHEERFRFEYLVQSLASPITGDMDGIGGGSANEHHESFEWEYKTACLSLMNALANSPSSLDDRISLRNELRRRGLEDVFQTLKMQSPPESLLIQINVYEDERHEDWVDLQERAYEAAQFKADQDSQNSELVNTINSLGPADDELYPRIMQTLQQYAEGAVSSLSQEETDDEDQESPDTISRQSLQFKEDLWTIVSKFGERVFQMRDIEKDWAVCQDEFLESIQHIVGKRGIILSFSDPNLNSSSSASMSSASLASSRRHSFIDYEMDIMRRDMEDMREESDNLRKELAAAKQETEDVKAQLRQQIRSPPSSSRELREGSDSELPTSYGKRENHAGVVQRLVQKEKEVAQLRETLDVMKKKYNDRAEFVTDDEPRKSERSKEIDSTRWNAMMTEVQVQKTRVAAKAAKLTRSLFLISRKQTAEAASLADDRQKEIAYLKRALEIVCTRYENAMGERPPAVTEEDHTNQHNQTEGSLQLSKTFEALARKDEEIIELKDEVERLRKETAVGLTPTEEVLSLRGSLKDVMLRVQELQTLVNDREKTIKGLKEMLFTLEAAKHPEDPNSAQGQDANIPGPSRVERSQTRSSLKLQIRALSAKGWQSEEVDEEHEEIYQNGSLSPSTSESNIQNLLVNSPSRQAGVTSPKIGQRFLGAGGGRRPALPPPPPPPGPKHKLYAAQVANAPNSAPQTGSAPPPPPPPPAQPMVIVASGPQIVSTPPTSTGVPQEQPQAIVVQTEHVTPVPVPTPAQAPQPESPKINTSAPPPPPPPPFVAAARNPQAPPTIQPSLTAVVQSSGGAPVPPPPPPFVAAPQSSLPAATTAIVTPTGSSMGGGPPPPPPPPPFLASSAPIATTPAEPLTMGIQRSVSMPAPKPKALGASPPTGGAPLPPPPPMPNAPFGKGALKPPSQTLPPPPPPGPQPQGAAALEGAIPTLPVFLPGNRTANPLKPLAMAIPQVVKPTRPMKQLFWNKLPTGTITNTVWKDICDPSSDLGTVELDFAEIDELFCKNQVVSATANVTKEKKKPVSLFNVSRANNIAIMLSRIKMTYPEIRAALMEILDDKLSIENLKAIKQYVPTGDEIELIKEFEGDFESLGHAEKFYREIYDIPRLSERVSSMIFRRRLEIDVGELKPEMDVLRLTIEELHSSRRLKSLLKTVLLIGNHLNATSFRGNAYGFQLDALLKIRDTKGVDNIKPGASTLLHYLAKSIHSKDPSLLKFLEEVPHLEAAARISVPTLMNSCNSLVAGMNQIREEIRVLRRIRISPPNDHFVDVMEKFADANEEGIQKIVELGQGLEQDLKKLLIFYGEDAVNTKPEDFFGMLVSFSTMLQKSQLENEAMAKKLLNKANQQQQQANKGKVGTAISVAAIRDGHLDDAIRGLRSGLRRNRKDRPMSHLYSELSMEALQAINLSVPRAGALTHSRQGSRQ
ncbi:hypothetical protein BGW39_001281 [Mortierella sp. 14UC]|nr:hypothetical protein BGW39_001281 [Mortierella sp. 14UC]